MKFLLALRIRGEDLSNDKKAESGTGGRCLLRVAEHARRKYYIDRTCASLGIEEGGKDASI